MSREHKIALALTELEYHHACKKHRTVDGGKGPHSAMSVLTEEVGEVAKALNEGDTQQAIKELGQVAAVSMRFIELLEAETPVHFVGTMKRGNGHV